MKMSIMQPYFFPYIGYIGLIKNTDIFILLDEVQYIYHGWISRNRVLKPNGGWQYIVVPLASHSRNTVIKNVEISTTVDWNKKIIAQLQHYKKAPFYQDVIALCRDVFNAEFKTIADLNMAGLKAVLEYLNIEKQIYLFSEMNLTIEKPNAPDEWALSICRAFGGVTEYWNPIGGKFLFNRKKYEQNGVALRFYEPEIIPYRQKGSNFEPSLSILDVMMFNSPETIIEMMGSFTLFQ